MAVLYEFFLQNVFLGSASAYRGFLTFYSAFVVDFLLQKVFSEYLFRDLFLWKKFFTFLDRVIENLWEFFLYFAFLWKTIRSLFIKDFFQNIFWRLFRSLLLREIFFGEVFVLLPRFEEPISTTSSYRNSFLRSSS